MSSTTIYDIARMAGVGVGTVSRVINNSPSVRPGTREKVQTIIAQLNYQPDPIARSMISRRTNAIGVIVPFFARPFNTEMLKGIESPLTRLGKDLILYNVETDEQRDQYFAEVRMRRKVDGLIILSLPVTQAAALNFKSMGIQVVLVDTYNPLFTSLVVDNVHGAYMAVKYLIERGHRCIGFINGIREGNFKFNQANDRLIGFHRAISEAELLFDPDLVLTSTWDRYGGKEAARGLLSLKKRPTAIFAASDAQAFGVLEAARELSISIPDELSVIGYDGIEISELLELTTIQQPISLMGELGVEKLLEHIVHPEKSPEVIQLQTVLKERCTTASLRRL